MKRESWNIRNSPKTRPSDFTLVKLSFFSSNSLKQVITRLNEMPLSLNPIRFSLIHLIDNYSPTFMKLFSNFIPILFIEKMV